MHTSLPIISAAGLFQSKDKFSDPVKHSDNTITKLRTVIDYELELFTMDGGVAHLNGENYLIKKGCLLIAQPGDRRQSTLHFSAIYVHFGTSDKAIQELIHTIAGFYSVSNFEKHSALLSKICETALRFEPDSDILASAKLIEFLCNIKKEHFRISSFDSKSYSLSAVSIGIDFMKQNYTEPLSVQQIAEHCCLSASHFHKLFVETVHTTPNNYLNQIRLAAAKTLLYSTSMSISEIAAKCGFHSQAYFSDCFKRYFSLTPKDFRNAYTYPDVKSFRISTKPESPASSEFR